jgi:D-alanyl-D-alanine carboxypeptidase
MPAVVSAGAPAYLVHVIDEGGEWQAAAGFSDLKKGLPANSDAQFRIGSITKTFVATAVLQLVGRGLIDLDAPIADYLPGLLSQGRVVTVRELLQHRAGLGSTPFGIDRGNTWYPALKQACRETTDPLAAIREADVQAYPPGTTYLYANAGYTALGLLLEKVTGKPYQQVLNEQIVAPLGLTRTSFQDGAPSWSGAFLHGYGNFQPGVGNLDQRNYSDETDCNMTLFSAAGSGISTTRDLATFMYALMHGRLLSHDLYAEMTTFLPTGQGFGYGMGLAVLHTAHCGDIIGHDGAVYGYQDSLYARADGSRVLAEAFPLFPGTDQMFSAISQVDAAELCSGLETNQ